MSAQMNTPGPQLKAAREALGKSLSDMADITRISIQQLEDLEADFYGNIPAPMYVRGFIKLYAQKLGLNHEPLVELYERRRKGELDPQPADKTPPRPVVEQMSSADNEEPAGHPELTRDMTRGPVTTPQRPAPRLDLSELKARLQSTLNKFDFSFLQTPAVRYGLIAVVVIILLLFGLRSCAKRPASDDTVIPEVEDPLLRPPEPVYFNLPSSYQ